jgi:hypothetical protein
MLSCGVDLVLLGKTLRRLQADFRQVSGVSAQKAAT